MAETKRLSVPINPARALRELSREQHAPKPENEENTTILQSDKPTDNPTDIPTNQQSDNQTNGQTNKPADQQTSQLSDTQTDNPTTAKRVKPVADGRPAKQVAPKTTAKTGGTRPAMAVNFPDQEELPVRRADGRTMRVRQDTADRTLVTSLRLAVSTVEALDEYCWRNRQRKQDVVQAALVMYFEAMTDGE